ncbi:MAG: VTT domain-containing protein [Pyrinomonadaceae bacterium]
MKIATKLIRYFCMAVWLSIIVIGISAYLISPSSFAAENIAAFLREFHGSIWIVYLLLSALRGFTLLPSTPLVLAGTMLYPQEPIIVLIISLLGILISSSMIYWFSDLLGFDEYFEAKKPRHVEKIKMKLEHPLGLGFVALWAFFPLVPTDAVCYVAGSIRMHFTKFIAAVLLGEFILCCIYVFAGGQIFGMLL